MIDSLTIFVYAGDGGDGRVSFKREKFRPFGGPDGGNGGKGGDVILKVNPQLRTLSHLRNKHVYKAQKGEMGGTNFRNGKSGEDLIIEVPLGTLVYSVKDNKKVLLADLVDPKQTLVVAKGGLGGLGNAHFKSSTNQTPQKATKGKKGESLEVYLEIKLLADVGLIGFPSVGKSSLVNALTKRSFKTASYPFTTLSPNIGVLHLNSVGDLVIADLPGLIEGASKGRGLGDTFLKHIERCGLILHVLDASLTPSFNLENFKKEQIAKELLDMYFTIRKELQDWSVSLLSKPEVLILNKIDMPKVLEISDYLRDYLFKNIPKNKALKGDFFGELVFFKVSSFNPKTLTPLHNFLKEHYSEIIKVSHSITFAKKRNKTYKYINLDNVPNKRIVFKS